MFNESFYPKAYIGLSPYFLWLFYLPLQILFFYILFSFRNYLVDFKEECDT